MTIFKEQPEALLPLQQIGYGLTKVGSSRDVGSLRVQPSEELIDERAGQGLPGGQTMLRI